MNNIIEELRKNSGLLSLKPATEEQIVAAQQLLEVCFTEEYKTYISTFGVATYHGHELTGISTSSRLNVVDVTLKERKKNANVQKDWYVIEQVHMDDIVVWQNSKGEIFATSSSGICRKLNNSLLEYVTASI